MQSEQQDFRIVELARRLANVVRPGVVTEVDPANAAVKVRYGEDVRAVTAWLPVMQQSAGGDSTWWAPEIGEQVVILAPSGELHDGIVLGAFYTNMSPAPSADPDKHLVRYSDGGEVEYDRAAHRLTFKCDVKIVGNAEIIGNLEVTGDVKAGGQVEDGLGTMNDVRTIYNTHIHGLAPGVVTPPPNERMK